MRLPVALVQLDAGTDVDANIARAAALADDGRRRWRPTRRPARVPPVPRSGRRVSRLRSSDPRSHDRTVRRGRPPTRRVDPGRERRRGLRPTRHGRTTRACCWTRPGPSPRATARSTCSTWRSTTDRSTRSRRGCQPRGRAGLRRRRRRAGRDSAICYDLRFPELYRSLALAGAEVLTVPADVHRADRPRPLGGAAAGAGHRERGVRHRARPRSTAPPGGHRGVRTSHDRRSVGHGRGPGAGRRSASSGRTSTRTVSPRSVVRSPRWPTVDRRGTGSAESARSLDQLDADGAGALDGP